MPDALQFAQEFLAPLAEEHPALLEELGALMKARVQRPDLGLRISDTGRGVHRDSITPCVRITHPCVSI